MRGTTITTITRRVLCLLLAAFALAVAACDSGASVPSLATAPASATAASAPAPSTAVVGVATPPASPQAAATSTAVGSCSPGAALTLAQTEGPYYKANPPQRSSLVEAGTTGTRLLLTGSVRGPDCQPLAGARVDFWQTDAAGAYDNAGFGFRGYQLTDSAGGYRLETVVPAEYPGRTPHIHVKVTPSGGPTLTSQLYLPDASRNASDGIFRPELVMQDFARRPEGASARFDFVVATR